MSGGVQRNSTSLWTCPGPDIWTNSPEPKDGPWWGDFPTVRDHSAEVRPSPCSTAHTAIRVRERRLQLRHDVVDVVRHGLLGDVERGRDLAVRQAAGDEGGDFSLSAGQARRNRLAMARGRAGAATLVVRRSSRRARATASLRGQGATRRTRPLPGGDPQSFAGGRQVARQRGVVGRSEGNTDRLQQRHARRQYPRRPLGSTRGRDGPGERGQALSDALGVAQLPLQGEALDAGPTARRRCRLRTASPDPACAAPRRSPACPAARATTPGSPS